MKKYYTLKTLNDAVDHAGDVESQLHRDVISEVVVSAEVSCLSSQLHPKSSYFLQ